MSHIDDIRASREPQPPQHALPRLELLHLQHIMRRLYPLLQLTNVLLRRLLVRVLRIQLGQPRVLVERAREHALFYEVDFLHAR